MGSVSRIGNAVVSSIVFLILFVPFVLFVPGMARAGTVYRCEPGDVHAMWACVNPEKPVPMLCQPTVANPVDVLTGRKHQEALDWSSGGARPLELWRFYSSSPLTLVASPYSSIGRGWRTSFDARAKWNNGSLATADWIHIVLPDGFEYHFNKQSGTWRFMIPSQGWSAVQWAPRFDLDVVLTIEGEWIVLRMPDDTRYVFDSGEHSPDDAYRFDGYSVGVLTELRFPDGYTQKLTYSGDYATRVADNLGRWIEFDYQMTGNVS